jgi:hypothetical protein
VVGSLVRKRARSGHLGPHHSLVLTAILDECKCLELHGPCGRRLPLLFALGNALAEEEAKAVAKGSSFLLVSLVGDDLRSHGRRLSTVFRRLQRTSAAFLLVLHAWMVTLLPSRKQGGKKGLNNLSNSSRPRDPSYKIL